MRTDSFDFHLPDELIAQQPSAVRDSCRLMVLHRDGRIEHRRFDDIPGYLSENDIVVLNDTKVFPARLTGSRTSGRPLEILLVKERCDTEWDIMSKGGYSGPLRLDEGISVYIDDGAIAIFPEGTDVKEYTWKHGAMPLPPYIRRAATRDDVEWYQTVYASNEGSVAAPTAGLHFTGETIERLKDAGVKVRFLTLHVGTGTFKPVRSTLVEEHEMDSEYFEMDGSLINEIRGNLLNGRKVVAVGTTVTRALEGCLSNTKCAERNKGRISGASGIFIYPGHNFRAVNGLLTNFHLPRSTPLMLAAAFAGKDLILRSYDEAVRSQYRFFSYGDAMLIL